MAQRGQIKSKVTEEEVKRLLETLSKADETTKVTVRIAKFADLNCAACAVTKRLGLAYRNVPTRR